jgi:hypothetical protein
MVEIHDTPFFFQYASQIYTFKKVQCVCGLIYLIEIPKK